jgi:hypothetical protein
VGQFVQRRFAVGAAFTLCFAVCLLISVVNLGRVIIALSGILPVSTPAGRPAGPPYIALLASVAATAVIWAINVGDAFIVGHARSRRVERHR